MNKWLKRAGVAVCAAVITLPMVEGTAAASGTGTIAVCVTNSQGNNVTLGANQVWYQIGSGSIGYVGDVGSSGCRQQTVPADTNVTVWAAITGTYTQHDVTQVADGDTTTVNFYTTNVTIQYPGSVAFGGPAGDYSWFKSSGATASRELFSNGVTPTMFRATSSAGYVHSIPVTWPIATGPGKTATFSLMAMQVLNNDGTGEAGATAHYQTHYLYTVPGSTAANGLLGWAAPGLLTNVTVTARVNNTTSALTQDVSSTGLFKFQTTKLTINYGDSVLYKSGLYGYNFSKPSMEFFAGTYPFQFLTAAGPAPWNPGRAYAQTDITVPAPADGPVTKTALAVRFQDSSGAGLVGSVSVWYNGAWHSGVATTDMTGVWNSFGPTTAGSAVVLIDGAPTTAAVSLNYNGEIQQLPNQNPQTKSVAYFHTLPVTVELADYNGNALDTGTASFYAGSWQSIGDTTNGQTAPIQMLPGSYSFAMTFLGTRQQKNGQPVAGSAATVSFQTGKVVSSTADEYYANGWKSFTSPMNMLAGNYTFHFNNGSPNAMYTVLGDGQETDIP